jgi:hypothetical protein
MQPNNNQFYEAVLEGRYPFQIDVHESPEGDAWVAEYKSNGIVVRTTESSQAEAHRQCTEAVVNAVREGKLNPY